MGAEFSKDSGQQQLLDQLEHLQQQQRQQQQLQAQRQQQRQQEQQAQLQQKQQQRQQLLPWLGLSAGSFKLPDVEQWRQTLGSGEGWRQTLGGAMVEGVDWAEAHRRELSWGALASVAGGWGSGWVEWCMRAQHMRKHAHA